MTGGVLVALPSDAPALGAPCECELCRQGVTRALHTDPSHDQRIVQDFAVGERILRITGGTTKCARLALGYALAHPEAFAGRRVLELGAGAGLLAIGLAVGLGCEVDATDQAPVLELLAANIAANSDPARHVIRARTLQWGEDLDAWRGTHDLVIGTDLNFARENLAPLLATLQALAADPGQAIVLASIRRAHWEDELFAALAEGFDAELLADAGDAQLHRFVPAREGRAAAAPTREGRAAAAPTREGRAAAAPTREGRA